MSYHRDVSFEVCCFGNPRIEKRTRNKVVWVCTHCGRQSPKSSTMATAKKRWNAMLKRADTGGESR